MKSSPFIYRLLLLFAFAVSDVVQAEFDTSVMTNVLHNMAVKQAMKSQQNQGKKNDQAQTANSRPVEAPPTIDNRQVTQTKALIVTGEGMYSIANNLAQAQVYPKILETVASSLKDRLIASGQSADVYLRTKDDPNIREFLPRILEHKLHNALIQVVISRENNGDIYITPMFNPLALQTNNVQILQGIQGKYQIYSVANPNAQMPTFDQVAEQFILDLKKNGYLKN